MTKVLSESDYVAALERLNALRSRGAHFSNSVELAELEAAVEAYEQRPDEPDESKGKPTPAPYDKNEESESR